MEAVPLERLPRGFRFHPTDEELVEHYLKRKITGRIEPTDDVIPEVDVCKCEPWDLPDKSLIRSDDPEWFFFAPKDRKYPNGLRSKRATEAGYWKATGKDRVIRSKAAERAVIGMKKTLVFHRGRAPRGVRSNWIMHEYRATEPEFDSGDQGGYVLYRLFKKPEEKSSSSNIDEVETGGSSPTSNKYSPDETQLERDAMEGNGTPLNCGSPRSDLPEEPESLADPVEKQPDSIRKQFSDIGDHSTICSAQPVDNHCYLARHDQEAKAGEKADSLQDVFAQFCDPDQQVDFGNFPNICSPMLPYTDHPFFDNINNGLFPVDNAEQDSLNQILNSMLNAEECSSVATLFQNDSINENVLRQSLWDSASGKCSRLISDLDTEDLFTQRAAGTESSKFLYGSSSLSTNPEHHLNTENASLPPYDGTGSELHSVDSSARFSLEFFNGMERSSNQKSIADHGDGFEGIQIDIRSRGPQHLPDSDDVFSSQGTASRRIRLQSSVVNMPFPSTNGKFSISKRDHKIKEAKIQVLQVLLDSIKESTMEIDKLQNEETEINMGTWKLQHTPNSNKISAQLGVAARGIHLHRKCKVKLFSKMNSKSSIGENHGSIVAMMETGGRENKDASELKKIIRPASPDKPEKLVIQDGAPYLEANELPKSTLSKRTELANDYGKLPKGLSFQPRTPRSHSVVWCVIWLILLVVLLPVCLTMCWSMICQSL